MTASFVGLRTGKPSRGSERREAMGRYPLHMGRKSNRISENATEPHRLALQESIDSSEIEWLKAENTRLKWVVKGLQEQLEQVLEENNG